MSSYDMRDQICEKIGIVNDFRLNDETVLDQINACLDSCFESIYEAWMYLIVEENN